VITAGPPHVRDALNVNRVMRCVILAILPCTAMALYTVGYLANEAIDDLAMDTLPGWRGDLILWLGLDFDSERILSCVVHGLLYFAPVYVVALAVGAACQKLFERVRGRPSGGGLGVTALVFALSLPATIPLWQVAIGIAVGVVIGKEIFGGLGRNLVNPALVGLAFLFYAYPGYLTGDAVWVPIDGYSGATVLGVAAHGGQQAIVREGWTWMETLIGRIPGAFGETSAIACALGAAVLLATRIASWRVVVAGVLGLSLTAMAFETLGEGWGPAGTLPWYWHLTAGSFAFGIVFLATDPVTSAMTDAGRWVYGALIGALVVGIRVANPAVSEGVMMAIILGNVFAPLIDHVVVRVDGIRRGRRLA
jgi:Na+-transporting NADH:ubiquinone oxidoreductase subunit B